MTVCSNESISAIVTSRHKCAICRGSDCSRKSRFPYFCVFSSLGKNPSCRSEASSRWLATSFCCNHVSIQSLAILLNFAPTSSSAMRFWMSSAILESKYLTSFSSTKFFFDWEDIFDFRSRKIFCATTPISMIPIYLSANTTYLWQGHLRFPNPSHSQT